MTLLPKSHLEFTAFPLQDGVAPHFTSRVVFYPQWIDQFCIGDFSLARGYIPYTKWIFPLGIERHPRGEVWCNPILQGIFQPKFFTVQSQAIFEPKKAILKSCFTVKVQINQQVLKMDSCQVIQFFFFNSDQIKIFQKCDESILEVKNDIFNTFGSNN